MYNNSVSFHQDDIVVMWKRFIDNISRNIITSNIKFTVWILQKKYLLYLLVVFILVSGGKKRKIKIPIIEMKFLYTELYVGSTDSSLVGNNKCLVRPVIQEYLFSINIINSHLQIVCVGSGLVRMLVFPLFCIN